MIDGHTQLYGLVRADPRASWSPTMHRGAFAAQGINAAYVPLSVSVEHLAAALIGAHALGFRGLNIGAPHKQGAAAQCTSLDPVALAVGAVNTLCRLDAGWSGYNTDALAFHQLFVGPGERVRTALVVGAGGAARATAWAFGERGIETRVAAHRAGEAESFCDAVRSCAAISWDELRRVAQEVDCVVNAIPCDVDHTRAIAAALRRDQVVVDWVYGGVSFTAAAKQLGCPLVTGDAILVRQGALANALWTGLSPPDAAMAAAIAGRA